MKSVILNKLFKRKSKTVMRDDKTAKKPLIKIFDLYIMRKFLGSFVFSIILLLAIVVLFDVNEKLDAIINS